MTSFETRLAAILRKMPVKYGRSDIRFLAAVSGGADSTAMLVGLAALCARMRFTLHCIHVEHGIRPGEESRGDALAVKTLCEELNVPCRIVSIPPGKIAAYAARGGPGIEGAARFFRYKILRRERRRVKADWILTAHTRDDQIETILMRVLRGSGPAGLAPMPLVRGRLLRPLLGLSRQDVLDYLAEKNIPYRMDSTNNDISYLRNRLRWKLVPILDEFFPFWRRSLLALAETQSLTADFLSSEVQKRLSWEEKLDKAGGKRSLWLNEADFLAAPPILREEAVFAGVNFLAAKTGRESCQPRRASVRRAADLGDAQDLGPVRLEKQGGFITLTQKERQAEKRDFSLLIKHAGLYTLNRKTLGLRESDLSIHVFAADGGNKLPPFVFAAQLPLVFRPHRGRDRISKEGRKRSLSDILDKEILSGYTGVITACDAGGTAAFIGFGKELLVISRDSMDCFLYNIKMFYGGKDV